MSNGTMRSKVEYGIKVTLEQASKTCSTSVHAEKVNASSFIGRGFRKVDFSDNKKMAACRKVNKMLGGY